MDDIDIPSTQTHQRNWVLETKLTTKCFYFLPVSYGNTPRPEAQNKRIFHLLSKLGKCFI